MPEKFSISDSKNNSKAFMKEVMQLSPSTIISLYEIDVTDLLIDNQFIFDENSVSESETKLRFHNTNTFVVQKKSIIWRGKEYIAAPIRITGFESTLQGALPKPVMGISVSDQSVGAFSVLKSYLSKLDDLVGAKVTRYKTFAKFLDQVNFNYHTPPQGFDPDITAEFPREVYYIERKSTENKFTLEFELASNLDVEGVRLPRRIVLKDRCPWSYRGAGCCYDFPTELSADEHGDRDLPTNFTAPPVATNLGTEIRNIIKKSNFVNRGDWNPDRVYAKGDFVRVTKNNINYYFVAAITVPAGKKPPNADYWIADECSKDIRGCRLRWEKSGLSLPYGGFPSASKQRNV